MSDKPKVNADAAMRLISQYDYMNEMNPLEFEWESDHGLTLPIDAAALDFWKFSGLGCRGFVEFVLFGRLEANTPDSPAAGPSGLPAPPADGCG